MVAHNLTASTNERPHSGAGEEGGTWMGIDLRAVRQGHQSRSPEADGAAEAKTGRWKRQGTGLSLNSRRVVNAEDQRDQ